MEGMKGCELCRRPARLHCEADQAWLCSQCDERVHSANFLVGKHSRNLLCNLCQSPTPWTASGTTLGSAISLCVSCSSNQAARPGESPGDSDQSDDDEEEEENDDVGSDDEEGENQVVPWSPPTAVNSNSSSGNESISRFIGTDYEQRHGFRDHSELGEEATSFWSRDTH